MGDTFRVIVDPVASLHEARSLALQVISYLQERNIIGAEQMRGPSGRRRYPAGKNCKEALAIPADYIPNGLEDGVDVTDTRTVFHNGGAGVDVVRCPLCLANQAGEEWPDAVEKWWRGDDLALLKCQRCKQSSPLTEWTIDPPWAFGNLGFTFWHWPPFDRNFVQKISDILGHTLVHVAGKM